MWRQSWRVLESAVITKIVASLPSWIVGCRFEGGIGFCAMYYTLNSHFFYQMMLIFLPVAFSNCLNYHITCLCCLGEEVKRFGQRHLLWWLKPLGPCQKESLVLTGVSLVPVDAQDVDLSVMEIPLWDVSEVNFAHFNQRSQWGKASPILLIHQMTRTDVSSLKLFFFFEFSTVLTLNAVTITLLTLLYIPPTKFYCDS